MTARNPSTPALVVIGFAEALSAPEVTWSLIDAGYKVVAFARRGKPAALAHSRHVEVHEVEAPEVDVGSSLDSLVELLHRLRGTDTHRHHVVLPLDDAALWLCSRAASTAGWVLAGPPGKGALDLALDKRHQIVAAREAGLDVPPTTIATAVADLKKLPHGFPLILRPADATRMSGQRLRKGSNWICCDGEELQAASLAWNGEGALLVQPYIDGTGEGVFGLMTDTGVVGWSAHQRLRMMNPHGSGSSACMSRGIEARLKAPITAFLESVGWRGMFMIEMLRTTDGRMFFVEFNGRAWGSMALARRLGLEYPAWSVGLAIGDSPELPADQTVPEGVVCRNFGRELMHLLFVLRGPRSRAIRAWPSFWSSLRAVFRPHPGGSFYNWRRGDWRVFASDCYYTVLRNVWKSRGA